MPASVETLASASSAFATSERASPISSDRFSLEVRQVHIAVRYGGAGIR
jgi:hypothetical protein